MSSSLSQTPASAGTTEARIKILLGSRSPTEQLSNMKPAAWPVQVFCRIPDGQPSTGSNRSARHANNADLACSRPGRRLHRRTSLRPGVCRGFGRLGVGDGAGRDLSCGEDLKRRTSQRSQGNGNTLVPEVLSGKARPTRVRFSGHGRFNRAQIEAVIRRSVPCDGATTGPLGACTQHGNHAHDRHRARDLLLERAADQAQVRGRWPVYAAVRKPLRPPPYEDIQRRRGHPSSSLPSEKRVAWRLRMTVAAGFAG